jgi:hypothetical protein
VCCAGGVWGEGDLDEGEEMNVRLIIAAVAVLGFAALVIVHLLFSPWRAPEMTQAEQEAAIKECQSRGLTPVLYVSGDRRTYISAVVCRS